MPKDFMTESSISELVQQLIEILKREASLFETFLTLSARQQAALVKNDLNELNAATEQLREKVIEANLAAKKREELIRNISADMGSRENLTITKLMKAVASGQSETLGNLRHTLLDFQQKIAKINSQNEMLINHSRENIMKTMQLLARLTANDKSYVNDGKPSSTQTSLTLDRRA